MTPDSPLDPKTLFEAHGAFVSRLARAMVADEHAAEDLAHETWAAVLRRPPIGVRDMRAWLSAILQRRVVSHRRREHHGASLQAIDAEPSNAASHGAAKQLEYEHVLHAAVRALDEPYRSTIFLRYHEELPPREIAARTDVPVKTVKTRLSRALAKLRDRLDGEFGDPSDSERSWRHALVPIGGSSYAAHFGSTTAPVLLSMKKLIAVAALLLASIGWFALRTTAPGPDAVPGAVPEVHLSAATTEPLDSTPALADVAESARVEVVHREVPTAGTPAPASDDSATLVVEVTGTEGQPVVNRPFVLKAAPWSSDSEAPRHVRSDSYGRSVFSNLTGTNYFLTDGLGAREEAVDIARGETSTLAWVVEGDVLIRGRVIDEQGDSVAGADVWCSSFGASGAPMSSAVQTDGNGDFFLSCSPEAAIQATGASWVPSALHHVLDLRMSEPGAREITLTLRYAGSPLSGRVVNEKGEPIGGASVVVHPVSWPGSESMAEDPTRHGPRPMRVVTDQAGRFETPFGLPMGEHPVAIRASGYAATVTSVYIDEGPAQVVFILQRGVDVTGVVTGADGKPGSQSHVWTATLGSRWQVHGDGYQPSTRSDDEGRFKLRNVALGRVAVRAQAGWKEELARGSTVLDLMESGAQDVALRLEAGRTMTGRTVDADGIPVSGMTVTAFCPPLKSNDVVSSADGSFRITALPEPAGDQESDDAWKLVVRTWTGASVQELAALEGVQPNSDPVDLVVERIESASGAIIGRIAVNSGSLPDDVQAWVGEDGVAGGSRLPFDPKNGAFRTRRLRPGTYEIRLMRAGVPVTKKSGLIVGAGETIDAGAIVLEIPGPR